tara:strand:+ start:181 stop:429 length:249 start_codon:yes stop_codon:yes gene_type:complete
MSTTMWIVGSIIFAVYMYFTIWNINNGVKPPAQREDVSYDVMDMDGMGNFSRFPTNIEVKKRNARKKKKSVRRQLVDDRKSK